MNRISSARNFLLLTITAGIMTLYFVRLYQKIEIQEFQYAWSETISSSQLDEQDEMEVSSFVPEIKELSTAVSNSEISQKKNEETILEDTTSEVDMGNYKATVSILSSFPSPTAYHIIVGYDPQDVVVNTISPGNIWSSSNILKSSLLQPIGKIEFAAGQGFGASHVDNTTLLIIEYTGPKNAVFTVLPESQFAYIGNSQSIMASSSNTEITID